MASATTSPELTRKVRDFVLRGFTPHYGELREGFRSDPLWARLRDLGTELWLDTGSIEDASARWTREFLALTTNNTLLNREVQKGTYDSLIPQAAELLAGAGLTPRQQLLEIAFILNARHGLRLVEEFDAMVSVEEHTDLAGDLEAAVAYARRYHAICPERFIVKIPLTPAGVLATRRLAREGVAVNHTLGFSARQNYVVARLARPAYVNVFLGRLNSVVADNKLGDGALVGERATLASQAAVRKLRDSAGVPTRQIGASFRAAQQVADLAGIDVMTLPPKVAQEFLGLHLGPPADAVVDKTHQAYQPRLADGVDPKAVRLDTLWDVPQRLVNCLDRLEQENLDAFTPDDLLDFFARHGCGDVLVRWSPDQVAASAAEGKIPVLDHWKEPLAAGQTDGPFGIGLDSLMNLAGLNSFTADQKEMDDRIEGLLS